MASDKAHAPKPRRASSARAVASRAALPRAAAAGLPAGYPAFLDDLKARIRTARLRAGLAANQELLLLYYGIGLDLHLRTGREAWGTAVVDRLARDLHQAFPDMEGLSPRNLRRMRAFYEAYPLPPKSLAIWPQAVAKIDLVKWPPAVAKLPWAHNVILLEKCKEPAQRAWYAHGALEHGWSRNVLALQIDARLHARQGRAVTNFAATLPPPQSDLAHQALKDPYVFDFLTIAPDALERALETDLVSHITRFLLELGAGFAFVGRQHHLEVAGEDYYLDLLFYHVRLHCYVVLDLKTGPFTPEQAGKMNFYLSAVDDQLRSPGDQPTIGLILCREKNRVTAEYALRDMTKPIGVADWQAGLTTSLPRPLRGSLPTVEEIEAELTDAPAKSDSHTQTGIKARSHRAKRTKGAKDGQ